MENLALILGILFFGALLLKSADKAVSIVRKIALETKVTTFVIASIFVSLSTSLPELFVGINSGINGVPTLSLGNILGANIANVSLVLGISGVLAGIVHIKTVPGLKREFTISFFAVLLPLFLMWDRGLSRLDGVVLIAFYALYASGFLYNHFSQKQEKKDSFWQCLFLRIKAGNKALFKNLAVFLGAVTILTISSYFIVKLTVAFAQNLNLPLFLIGLVFLSVGTTLPEIALSLKSIQTHQPSILVGNKLGAIVTNSTLVLGVVSLLSPFEISFRRTYALPTLVFIGTFVLFWFLAYKKHTIFRWEAALFLLIYFVFIALELIGFYIF